MPRARSASVSRHDSVVKQAVGVTMSAVGRRGAHGDNGGGGDDGQGGGGKGDKDGCNGGSRNGNGQKNSRRGRWPHCGKPNGQEDYSHSTNTVERATSPTGTASAAQPARFSPLAAGFIGALLSFVVVSAIVWGTYFFVRRRRARARRAKAAHPSSHAFDVYGHQRALTPVPLMAAQPASSRAVSPMPYFVNTRDPAAQEKSAEDFNPFVHPQEPPAVDPFAEPYHWKPSNSHPWHTLSA